LLTLLAVPLALGSYLALPFFFLQVPLILFRLIHEERTLRRHLPSYEDYCLHTRFRLVPGLW
jgi:protein-S-isoprenylcysteine O-methyltransferase Ste14